MLWDEGNEIKKEENNVLGKGTEVQIISKPHD
jgi:hypothetical protein